MSCAQKKMITSSVNILPEISGQYKSYTYASTYDKLITKFINGKIYLIIRRWVSYQTEQVIIEILSQEDLTPIETYVYTVYTYSVTSISDIQDEYNKIIIKISDVTTHNNQYAFMDLNNLSGGSSDITFYENTNLYSLSNNVQKLSNGNYFHSSASSIVIFDSNFNILINKNYVPTNNTIFLISCVEYNGNYYVNGSVTLSGTPYPCMLILDSNFDIINLYYNQWQLGHYGYVYKMFKSSNQLQFYTIISYSGLNYTSWNRFNLDTNTFAIYRLYLQVYPTTKNLNFSTNYVSLVSSYNQGTTQAVYVNHQLENIADNFYSFDRGVSLSGNEVYIDDNDMYLVDSYAAGSRTYYITKFKDFQTNAGGCNLGGGQAGDVISWQKSNTGYQYISTTTQSYTSTSTAGLIGNSTVINTTSVFIQTPSTFSSESVCSY